MLFSLLFLFSHRFLVLVSLFHIAQRLTCLVCVAYSALLSVLVLIPVSSAKAIEGGRILSNLDPLGFLLHALVFFEGRLSSFFTCGFFMLGGLFPFHSAWRLSAFIPSFGRCIRPKCLSSHPFSFASVLSGRTSARRSRWEEMSFNRLSLSVFGLPPCSGLCWRACALVLENPKLPYPPYLFLIGHVTECQEGEGS